MSTPGPERSVVFVDGNNWFHALKRAGLNRLGYLNYAKVSAKVVGPRDWTATRYYVGRVQQKGDLSLYAAQRRYLSWLESRDRRISIHYGRLEEVPVVNAFAKEVKAYLAALTVRIDQDVYRHLVRAATQHERTTTIVEKAVDVMLAVDLVRMAERNEYDVAYLLTADGDYTPAAQAAAECGKKVFAVAIEPGAQLAKVVRKFIPVDREWLMDCFGD